MCCVIYKCYINRVGLCRWLPVVAEYMVIAWTYYVYVVVMCLFTSEYLIEKVLLLVFYHILMGLGLWSQLKAIFTTPRTPLKQFYYDEGEWYKLNHECLWIQKREEMEKLRVKLGIKTTQASMGRGLLVYCQQCKVIKPDRCHHCSRCGVCVLKMDHHCPWINNCVGYHNYKFFLLFAIYILICSIYITATSMRFVIVIFKDIYNGDFVVGNGNGIQIIVMFGVLVMTGIAIAPLLKLHCWLASRNITTLENTRPVELLGRSPDLKAFDVGLCDNLLQIFGRDKFLWCFPVFTSLGDGAHFPLREDFLEFGIDSHQSLNLEE